jgi:TMEM175 potassium channel family protein
VSEPVTDSGRVEAFSDGVFAIAITLLVLELAVPKLRASESLWSALGEQWPSYAAYVVSFLVIGIIWANHHTVFTLIVTVDRMLLFLNLLMLLVVAALPWPTALLAEYLDAGGPNSHIAAAVYSGFMVAHALTFSVFWWYATRTGHLFHPHVDRAGARATRARFALGTLAYPVTVGLAFVSAPLTLAAHGVLAVYYAFNQIRVPVRPSEPG